MSAIFRVALTSSAIFAGLVVFYATLTNYQVGRPPNVDIERLRLWVACGGVVASILSFIFQGLSVLIYNFFRRVYLSPLSRELGLSRELEVEDAATRKIYEVVIVIALHTVYVVYLAAWLLVLHQNHHFFG